MKALEELVVPAAEIAFRFAIQRFAGAGARLGRNVIRRFRLARRMRIAMRLQLAKQQKQARESLLLFGVILQITLENKAEIDDRTVMLRRAKQHQRFAAKLEKAWGFGMNANRLVHVVFLSTKIMAVSALRYGRLIVPHRKSPRRKNLPYAAFMRRNTQSLQQRRLVLHDFLCVAFHACFFRCAVLCEVTKLLLQEMKHRCEYSRRCF
jgi:hypothetical protein